MKKTFAALHARTICHATENLERVKMALRQVVGDAEIQEARTEGHHGNPITVLEASVNDNRAIDEFFRRMGPEEIGALVGTLDRRIDEGCNLFIKLDKQAAFLGRLEAARNEDVVSIRLKANAFPAKCEVAAKAVREHLEAIH